MRLETLLPLPDGPPVRLREIRVSDVRSLAAGGQGAGSLAEWLAVGDCIDPAGRDALTDADAAAIWAAFEALNHAFFNPRARSGGGGLAALDSACIALISRGHANAGSYGWSFFLAALDSVKEN